MSTLLDITTDPDMQEELSSKLKEYLPHASLVHSDNIQNALQHIEQHEVDAIFVDTRIVNKLRQDVNVLLASTSLTTKIILIDSRQGIINTEPYNILGLKTIHLPLSSEELFQAIA